MKIVILQGSPNKKGSTNILTEEFTRGAKEAGHEVRRFDLTDLTIHPCTGCVACGYEGPCVQKDDNQKVRAAMLEADMVVDRFCAYNSSITRKHMKSALLTVAWNSDGWTFDALGSHYQTLVRYLDFEDCGMVLGRGCGSPSMTKHSPYPKMAYELGRGL